MNPAELLARIVVKATTLDMLSSHSRGVRKPYHWRKPGEYYLKCVTENEKEVLKQLKPSDVQAVQGWMIDDYRWERPRQRERKTFYCLRKAGTHGEIGK